MRPACAVARAPRISASRDRPASSLIRRVVVFPTGRAGGTTYLRAPERLEVQRLLTVSVRNEHEPKSIRAVAAQVADAASQ